jgi:predicted phosphodiesterase
MEILRKVIKKDSVNVYVITDVHVGAMNCNERGFKEFVKTILKDPDGYWIGLGDYIDCINFSDRKRFSPIEVLNEFKITDLKDLPRVQMKRFYEMIAPIQDKCLALVVGNHEEAYIKYNHFDIYDYLANDLMRQKDLKIGYNGFLKLNFGTQTRYDVDFYLTHGAKGGGMTEGYPINYIHGIAKEKEADIYLSGHIHQLVLDVKDKLGTTSKCNLKNVRKVYAVCGTWLNKYQEGTSGYFESARGWQTTAGYVKINLNNLKHDHPLTIKPELVYV